MFVRPFFRVLFWSQGLQNVSKWYQKVIQKCPKISLFADMGNLIPICYLLYGSHIGPSRGGSKSHQKKMSSKNSLKINKMSENVQKSASRGYPGGDQRSNIFRSFSVLGPWVTFWCQGWSQSCQNVPKWYQKGTQKGTQEQLFRDFY